MKKFLAVLLVLVSVFAFYGCDKEEYVTPEVLEVQLIPSKDAEVLNAYRGPLEALLEVQMEMDVNVTIATTYNALIEGMKAGQIHVGLLATTAYVLAHDEGAADVILKSLRYDVDDNGQKLYDSPLVSGYKSQLVAHVDSGIDSVEDLEGKTIAIASFTSTSGFVWPANLLADHGLDPETDVTWLNTGGHDKAIEAVINGQADAAFTFKDARSIVDYEDVYDEVIFITDTTIIPNDTIAVVPNLDPEIVQAVKDAFLAIAASEASRAIVRAIYEHEGYAEATDEEYDIVRTYLERQEEWEIGD
ncbi:MAG: phosphate/phosphite/phosphonate ABC transporter substrate-binding protein [Bacilli bacterium]|nr:phosphate/phosphite/phosphonate ABC transporter substrate-binding protein [Bacilli bacterium]MBN2695958.1 phosphate/phosphite/phosphonate ABC transporter substrate-binding protein [Bacilli bacterium]